MKRPTLYLALLTSTACIASGQAFCSSGPTATDTRIIQGTPTPTPSPTPISDRGGASPSPAPSLPPCVPETRPAVCLPGSPTLLPILLAAQAEVAWAPEGIYVEKLVTRLNLDPRVCAIGGFPNPSDEVRIKYRNNSSSESYDVVNANGTIQAIPAGPLAPNGQIANQCTPAAF